MNKRVLTWAAGLLLSIALVVGGFGVLKKWRFDTDAPEASFPPPADIGEARRQDVEHLAGFFEYERSWTDTTLRASRAAYEQLQETAETMSDAEFDLAVARVVARADNAHTKVREYSRTTRYSRLPVRGHWFADGYVIVRAYKGFESLLGHEITAIGGMPMAQVANTLRQYVGGPEGTFRKYAPYLIESPELMHAAGIGTSPDAMELTLENRLDARSEDRSQVILEPPFPPSSDQIARSHYLLTKQVFANSQPDWRRVGTKNGSTPVYLDFPDRQMQMRDLPKLAASYLQFWTNSNVGSTRIDKFCEQGLARYRSNPSRHLIVDQRFNSGGDFTLTEDCLDDLGRSVPDDRHLYVIIGGATFSAGIYSAAFLKNSAADRAVLIGEAVGDTLTSWGEDNLLVLPNSGIEIKFSTGMHDLTQPCRDWKRCQWDALFVSLEIDDLDPDIAAPLRFSDFLNGIDPAMEAIREHITREGDM